MAQKIPSSRDFEIYRMAIEQNVAFRTVAKRFGVSRTTVYNACDRVDWYRHENRPTVRVG